MIDVQHFGCRLSVWVDINRIGQQVLKRPLIQNIDVHGEDRIQ